MSKCRVHVCHESVSSLYEGIARVQIILPHFLLPPRPILCLQSNTLAALDALLYHLTISVVLLDGLVHLQGLLLGSFLEHPEFRVGAQMGQHIAGAAIEVIFGVRLEGCFQQVGLQMIVGQEHLLLLGEDLLYVGQVVRQQSHIQVSPNLALLRGLRDEYLLAQVLFRSVKFLVHHPPLFYISLIICQFPNRMLVLLSVHSKSS